jgi:hypothetical protein
MKKPKLCRLMNTRGIMILPPSSAMSSSAQPQADAAAAVQYEADVAHELAAQAIAQAQEAAQQGSPSAPELVQYAQQAVAQAAAIDDQAVQANAALAEHVVMDNLPPPPAYDSEDRMNEFESDNKHEEVQLQPGSDRDALQRNVDDRKKEVAEAKQLYDLAREYNGDTMAEYIKVKEAEEKLKDAFSVLSDYDILHGYSTLGKRRRPSPRRGKSPRRRPSPRRGKSPRRKNK